MENVVTELTKDRIADEIKKSVWLRLLKEGIITEKEYYTLNKIS